jgi:hypothetical protein
MHRVIIFFGACVCGFVFDLLGSVFGYWLFLETREQSRLLDAQLWKSGLRAAVGLLLTKLALGLALYTAIAILGAIFEPDIAELAVWIVAFSVFVLHIIIATFVMLWALELDHVGQAIGFVVVLTVFQLAVGSMLGWSLT